MKKTDSKKITRGGTKISTRAGSSNQLAEPAKDENRINRVAINDDMSLTLGGSAKKLLAFKLRF